MYKQLKKQLSDKRVLEDLIRGYEDRIKFKIQKQLGLHATSYAELKIECPVVDDRFARVFSQIENLDRELQALKGELEIINQLLENADDKMKQLSERDMKIFRCRFFLGLTVAQTAERLNYDQGYIKERTRKMLKN